MTRIENESEEGSQIAGMRSEIEKLKKDLKRKQSKKFFNCGTCLIILLLVIFVCFYAAAYVLAKTGLKTVPIFSDYFYSEPVPAYLVNSMTFDQQKMINRFEKAVTSQALSQKKNENLEVDFDISDEEITALLREQMSKDPSFSERIDYWQIAAKPDILEIFMKFKKPAGLILIMEINPEVKEGRLKLNAKHFTLGQLHLPGFIGSFIFENIGEKVVNKFLDSWQRFGSLEEISIYSYKVKLKVLINNSNDLSDAF